MLAWLQGRGYKIMDDWRPIRVELASASGRVDVHPMQIQPNGDGIQRGFADETFVHPAQSRTVGVIGARDVVVACAERLRELHTEYNPRPADVHDLDILNKRVI